MANRFVLPLETPVDATGAPYAGGKLFFYASGTSTKLNTYSDEGLTIANSNPVVLDSAGRFPNAIFLQNLAYKVVFSPSTDSDPPTSPIWTQDPVYASDYSTVAQFRSGNGSPNGSVAGTQGSATIPASAYWDYSDNILYVCTTSGTSSTALWTAINASTAAAVVTPPQGYLTLTSGTPVITGDVAASTVVYYAPYVGLLVPIYNGVSLIPTSIVSELQLTLSSSHTANNIYDFLIFSLNGVATLGSGPSWSAGTAGSITAGSCARGTGVGGAALSRIGGILTNTVSMTIRYGDGTVTTTVDPGKATYVGSMFVDGTNGEVSCYRSWGQNRKWGIWNAYNRVPICLQVGDSTSNWTYNINTFRQSNASTGNKATVFTGLAEETMSANFIQQINTASGAAYQGYIAIGWNSTTTVSGTSAQIGTASASQVFGTPTATYTATPFLGINNINCLEKIVTNTGQFNGTQDNMVMSVSYRG